MFILQTLKDFVHNPMGKGSNAIPSRQIIIEDLKNRFNKIIKEKKIVPTIYRNGDEYYFHFLIPSEDIERENTYDVVLHFTLDENEEVKNDPNLKRYLVKFFSNSPSFTYTFAYAFRLYGLFIEELEDKYHKQVFEKMPVTRNPAEIVGYEKTIFFACLFLLKEDKYLNKIIINSLAKPFDLKKFTKTIRHTDKIELEIKKETQQKKNLKEEEKLPQIEKKSSGIESKGREGKRVATNGTKNTTTKGKNKITPRGKIKPRTSSFTKKKN